MTNNAYHYHLGRRAAERAGIQSTPSIATLDLQPALLDASQNRISSTHHLVEVVRQRQADDTIEAGNAVELSVSKFGTRQVGVGEVGA